MFKYNEEEVPKLNMARSIYTSFDENIVTYEANGVTFQSPSEEDLDHARKTIYAWIAWYNRLSKLDSSL